MNRTAILIALLLVTLWSAAASACGSPGVAPIDIVVQRLSPTSALVLAQGYDTFGSTFPPQVFCACGFGVNPDSTCGVVSIDAVTFRDHTTQVPLGAFSFAANNNTSAGFGAIQSGAAWWGFLSSVTVSIAGGQAIDLDWSVTTTPCSDVELQSYLLNNLVLGTDEGDMNGNLTGNHQVLVTPASVTVLSGPIPVEPDSWGSVKSLFR